MPRNLHHRRDTYGRWLPSSLGHGIVGNDSRPCHQAYRVHFSTPARHRIKRIPDRLVISCLSKALTVACLVVALVLSSCGRRAETKNADTNPKQIKDGPATEPASPVHVFAQIVRKSPVPDPKHSDYADCLYTAEVKVLQIDSQRRAPRELVLMLPAFFKRTLQPEAGFKVGAVIEADILPNAEADEARRRMQRADDLERMELELYQTVRAHTSADRAESFFTRPDNYFAVTAPADAAKEPQAKLKYPWSEKTASERKAAIERDKHLIHDALASHGGDWEGWRRGLEPFCDSLNDPARAMPDKLLRKGRYSFSLLRKEAYYDLCMLAETDAPGPVRMLKSLNQQLRARGIDLIVVPFPSKEDVHADVFSDKAPADGWFLPCREKLMLQLLEADIEVIELIQPLRQARDRFPWMFYDNRDQHPADGAIQVAAEEIANRLARYELKPKDGKPLKLKLRAAEIERADEGPNARYPTTQVLTEDDRPLVIPENSGSPVVIMGDSYTMMPTSDLPGGPGAAIPMHIAHRIGIVPNQLSSMGSSDKVMKLLAREGGNYLANRCAVVFVFSPQRMMGNDSGRDGNSWNLTNLPPLMIGK